MVVVSLEAKQADARPFGVNLCHVVFDDALEPLAGDPRADAGSCRESAWEPVRSATRGVTSEIGAQNYMRNFIFRVIIKNRKK